MLGVCLVQLEVGGGVDGGNVLVREGQDSVAGLAAARLDLLEQKRDGALGIIRLPSNGDSETGVEGSVQSEPSIGVLDDAHEGRAIQQDDLALVPLDNDIGDVEAGEDLEDVRRRIANVPRLGAGANSDPDYDRAEA